MRRSATAALQPGLGCGFGNGGLVTNGCDGDWSTWWLGSRTQWNVTKDFYMGLDVMYSKLNSATAFNGTAVGTGTLLVPLAISQPRSDTGDRPGQLVVPVPRPSRLLSLIA